jgi:hypothetical protein
MTSFFSENKSHEENVKTSIDKILGQETSLRKVKKSGEDHKRILFNKILSNLVIVEERSVMMDEIYSMDMSKYNNLFFDIIEDMLALHFSKQQINLINFFLYDRYSAEGAVTQLFDKNGDPVKLDNADDLWQLLKTVKNEK